MASISKIHLGKHGITDNFIFGLKNHFKNHMNVKISVLKNAGHEKSKIKKYSEEILNSLGKNYTARIIGFTINVKKWRRNVRK